MLDVKTYQFGEETKVTMTGKVLFGIIICLAGGVTWATTITLQISQVQKDISEIKQVLSAKPNSLVNR